MRKISYTIANILMRLFKKDHAFRYIAYYKLQIIVNTILSISFTFMVSLLLNTTIETLIMILVFFIIKPLFTNHYHATSMFACSILSTTMLTIPSVFYKYSGNFSVSVSVLILIVIFSTLDKGAEMLDNISMEIDYIVNLVKLK